MNVQRSSVEQIEQQLVSLIEESSVDLSVGGELLVERLSIPHKSDQTAETKLTYYLHKTPKSVVDCHLYVTSQEEGLSLEVELSLKKFITPTLSLTSAHVAGLIHHLKRWMSSIYLIDSEGVPISWEFNRTQRRIRLLSPLILQGARGAQFLNQITQLLLDSHELSAGIVQEEAEYCQVMEHWRHARRAYLTWSELAPLDLEQLQTALTVLHRLKDWTSCVRLLAEGSERFNHTISAKLAHACSVLYRDVILDSTKALEMSERALALDPDQPLYQKSVEELRISDHQIEASESQPIQISAQEMRGDFETEDSDEVQELFDDLPFDEQIEDEGNEEENNQAEMTSSPQATTTKPSRTSQRLNTLSRHDKNTKKSRRSRKQKVKRNKKRGKR
jgi:hypothetical protein